MHFLQFVHWLKYPTVHLVGFQRSNWNWHFVQESVTSSPILCYTAICLSVRLVSAYPPISQHNHVNIDIYRVLIIYCGFCLKIFVYIFILDSGLSRFSLGVHTGLHAWTARWQVEHQRRSRTGRVQKNHNF